MSTTLAFQNLEVSAPPLRDLEAAVGNTPLLPLNGSARTCPRE
jgi:hypothetical protein